MCVCGVRLNSRCLYLCHAYVLVLVLYILICWYYTKIATAIEEFAKTRGSTPQPLPYTHSMGGDIKIVTSGWLVCAQLCVPTSGPSGRFGAWKHFAD